MTAKKTVERLSSTMANTDAMGDLVNMIHPALHRVQDWPYPDQIDHALYRAYMKQPHDLGGEPDAQGIFEEKEEEQWELNTFVDCEVLGWKGIWTSRAEKDWECRHRTYNVLRAPVLRSLALGDRPDPHGKAAYNARRVGREGSLGAGASVRSHYSKSSRS